MAPKRTIKPKAGKQPKQAPASPLEEKRRALEEAQEKLKAEIARRQKLIEEAPKIAEEQERLRRNEIIARKSRTEARFGTRTALHDPRFVGYEANVAVPSRPRRLKAERRQGMLTFFFLCIVLMLVLAWLYFTIFRNA
jgi:hypothetical protein